MGLLAVLAGTVGVAQAIETIAGTERIEVFEPNAALPKKYEGSLAAYVKAIAPAHRLQVTYQKFYDPSVTEGLREMASILTTLDANGVRDGEETFFRPLQHQPVRIVTWKAGVQDGPEKQFQVVGGKYYLDTLIPWKNGKVHGVKQGFYPDGKVLSEASYVQGRLDGVSKNYEPDGFVTRSSSYRDGKRDGPLTEYWNTTRKLKKTINYKMGKVDGQVRQYYDSGKLKMEAQLWDDKYHGIQKEYDEDGKLRQARYWILDKQVSPSQFEQEFRPPTASQPADKPASGPAK